jgi:hypothetical protein
VNEPDPKNGGPQVPSAAFHDATSPDATEPKVESVQIANDPGGEVPDGEGGYKNMWVPLFVVPAAIIIVPLVIWAMFGSISGSELTVEENLRIAVNGGKNERQQARFSLIRQLTENLEYRARGEEPPNAVPAGFGALLEAAASELEDDGAEARLALAVALANFEPELGANLLIELLDIQAEDDDGGRVRFSALANLGWLAIDGVESAKGGRELAIALMGDEDPVLRMAAASVLPHFEVNPESRTALLAALDDGDLQVRATSALSLSMLATPDPSAIPLLTDMAGAEIWIAARDANPGQFRRAADYEPYQVQAVLALLKYGDTTRAAVQELADNSPSLKVQDAARRGLDQ